LIHRLLAEHSQVIAPPLKELVFPGKLGVIMRTIFSLIPQNKVDAIYHPDLHKTGANFAEADDIALMAAFGEGIFGWAYAGALNGLSAPEINAEKHLPYLKKLYSEIQNRHPNKIIVSKYFAGVRHYNKLKEQYPKGKFILLLRDPEKVCYSVSTLIGSALEARNIVVKDPGAYWKRIYEFIVETYHYIALLINEQPGNLLIVSDEAVKGNLSVVIREICDYSGLRVSGEEKLLLAITQKTSKGKYHKPYEYSKVMDGIFSTTDFDSYYKSLNFLKKSSVNNL
jgi:hypothetical protein